MDVIPDNELVVRAISVGAARHRARVMASETEAVPLWAVVTKTFACGSTMAKEICRKHGRDPDEQVGIAS